MYCPSRQDENWHFLFTEEKVSCSKLEYRKSGSFVVGIKYHWIPKKYTKCNLFGH